uniref:Uncharacterized protein n=1 Tax=Rhizophora mucronata TaxID=61149 RepID=A0A2P2PQG1_RHIMU
MILSQDHFFSNHRKRKALSCTVLLMLWLNLSLENFASDWVLINWVR